jgi:hypothetical protein
LQNQAIAKNVQKRNVQRNAKRLAAAQKLLVKQAYAAYVNK